MPHVRAGHVPIVGADTRCAGASVLVAIGHAAGARGNRHVILWADTFNNYFHPEREPGRPRGAAGRRASPCSVPGRHLCCGRPLYDFGFLDQATTYLQPHHRRPGPGDRRRPADRRARTELRVGVSRRTAQSAPGRCARESAAAAGVPAERVPGAAGARAIEPPQLAAKVLLARPLSPQGAHEDERRGIAAAQRWAPSCESPDAGCCGMAGPFGFAKDKFDVSQAVGERVLLPAVRQAAPETRDRVRRIQLSGADPAGDRTSGRAPRGSDAGRVAHRPASAVDTFVSGDRSDNILGCA